jgi:hypothetical protein
MDGKGGASIRHRARRCPVSCDWRQGGWKEKMKRDCERVRLWKKGGQDGLMDMSSGLIRSGLFCIIIIFLFFSQLRFIHYLYELLLLPLRLLLLYVLLLLLLLLRRNVPEEDASLGNSDGGGEGMHASGQL